MKKNESLHDTRLRVNLAGITSLDPNNTGFVYTPLARMYMHNLAGKYHLYFPTNPKEVDALLPITGIDCRVPIDYLWDRCKTYLQGLEAHEERMLGEVL